MYKAVIRLLVLVALLLNQILIVAGFEPFPATEEQLYEFFSTIVLGVVALWTFWKNNSFTKYAKEADEYLDERRKLEEGDGL